MCCPGAWVACVGVWVPLAAWRAAAALALAVALWMRSAGRGGSEEEVEDVDEDEDEEEVVVLADVGCAAMREGAALWAASAPATAGRMEGMFSGRGWGAGGWEGPAVTWQPGGPIWSAAVGRGGAGLRSPPSGLGWAGLLQCVRACGLVSPGGEHFAWAAFGGRGGFGLAFWGGVRGGGGAGHWAGWVRFGAFGFSQRVWAGCRVWGVVRGVQREGLGRE